MLKILLILSLSILMTGMAVDYIFQLGGWIPHVNVSHQISMQMQPIQWDYNAVMNIIFIPIAASIFLIGRREM